MSGSTRESMSKTIGKANALLNAMEPSSILEKPTADDVIKIISLIESQLISIEHEVKLGSDAISPDHEKLKKLQAQFEVATNKTDIDVIIDFAEQQADKAAYGLSPDHKISKKYNWEKLLKKLLETTGNLSKFEAIKENTLLALREGKVFGFGPSSKQGESVANSLDRLTPFEFDVYRHKIEAAYEQVDAADTPPAVRRMAAKDSRPPRYRSFQTDLYRTFKTPAGAAGAAGAGGAFKRCSDRRSTDTTPLLSAAELDTAAALESDDEAHSA